MAGTHGEVTLRRATVFSMDHRNLCIFLITAIPLAEGAVPGTFFWKPRLGLDMTIPSTEAWMAVHKPSHANIYNGLVVLIDGYQAGMTVLALATAFDESSIFPQLDPNSAYFYTQAFRWSLRYLSLLPSWLGGQGGNYCDTHKTWRRRFYYMDLFIPKWGRLLLPHIKKAEWDKEEYEMGRYNKYARPAFGKHMHYPGKRFRDFQSDQTVETQEGLDSPNSSR